MTQLSKFSLLPIPSPKQKSLFHPEKQWQINHQKGLLRNPFYHALEGKSASKRGKRSKTDPFSQNKKNRSLMNKEILDALNENLCRH